MKFFNNAKVYDKILVLPDIHAPFFNWKAVKVAAKWAKRHKPELVIQLGDIMDQKAWSRFPKDADDPSPHQEFELSIEAMDRLADMFPDMELLLGNHDLRIAKAALEVGFTKHIVRDLEEIFEYPGWNWHSNPRDHLIVNTRRGPVLFRHGDEEGGTAVAKSRLFGMSVVQGHTHQASIGYTSTMRGQVFGMECGHLMDTTSKAATYACRNGKYPVTGIGIIKYGVPYFLPLTGEERTI
jgi:predicted phosphodiesterase